MGRWCSCSSTDALKGCDTWSIWGSMSEIFIVTTIHYESSVLKFEYIKYTSVAVFRLFRYLDNAYPKCYVLDDARERHQVRH